SPVSALPALRTRQRAQKRMLIDAPLLLVRSYLRRRRGLRLLRLHWLSWLFRVVLYLSKLRQGVFYLSVQLRGIIKINVLSLIRLNFRRNFQFRLWDWFWLRFWFRVQFWLK